MAFFPMHFWMVRAYSSAAPFILTYLAAISSILGVYIILRFMHFTIEGEVIHNSLTIVLRPTAIATITICTFLALKADTLKKVVIYSTASQIGYVFLLITIWAARDLLFQLLILDAINKIALFTIIAHIQNKTNDLRFENFKAIESHLVFKILVAFALIFSAGLPLTSMFLVKIKLFDLLLSRGLIIEFIVVIFGGVLGLLYHFRLAKALFFSPANNGTIKIQTKLYGLTAIIIIQMVTLIYGKELASFAEYTESLITGV
jgi:multicomponent Na+:H+ antiporter subunit D